MPYYIHEATYRGDHSHPVHDMEIDLPFGDVTVLAVAHIVPKGHTDDYFFNTRNLSTIISFLENRQGKHDNVYRDCFGIAENSICSCFYFKIIIFKEKIDK